MCPRLVNSLRHAFDTAASLPLAPPVREFVAPQAVSCGQSDDIDSLLGEGFVDVVAQLLAFVRLVGSAIVVVVYRVQGQDNALHSCEHALVRGGLEGQELRL